MSRATACGVVLGVLCALCGFASSAAAQPADPGPRFNLGIGVIWDGRQPLGGNIAKETTAAGGASTLFSTSSELAGAAGAAARLGVRLTRSLVAEAEASYLKPELRIAISGDAENAAAVTALDTTQQFTIGGGVVWYLPGRRWSPRFAPFATAGGGYLRQLHEQNTFLQTGRYYQLGGGLSTLLVKDPHVHIKGVGIRADLRALVRSKGVAFDGGSKTSPAAGLSAFVRF